MALQPIQLDNLDWDQITAAIQTRIIPDSQGKWTLQAPVDPGVTMLELFAWLLDQRIYWMNQVPASLSLAVLSLLGDSPNAAQAAVTLLQLSDSAMPARPLPLAAAGTLMQLVSNPPVVPPILFTTNDDLTVLPLTGIAISVDGVDYTNDLQQCQLIPLLASGKNSSQIEIVLQMSAQLPAVVSGQFFSLMLELETSDDIFPQWSPNAVTGVAAPATLTWSYTSTSTKASASFTQVTDGTAGLRRSGVVRLSLPADWQPEPQGANPTITSYKVLLQIQSATFTYPPQLQRLQSNVVLAQHIWNRAKNPVTSQWLPLPGNVVSLPDAPSDSSIQEYPPIENTLQLQVKGSDGAFHPWQRVSGFSLSSPTDQVFVVDRSNATVCFGNGLTGRLPVTSPADVSDITVTYQAGGGTAGNVGQGLSWVAVPAKDAGAFPQFTATNLTAGDGGAETETLADAGARSAANLADPNRAVSQADYQNLAQTTPGVGLARAYAAVGYHPDFPNSTVPGAVTVFVVPYAPRAETNGDLVEDVLVAAPMPDPGALEAAQSRLNAAKLIGGEVFVCPPIYRKVWLTVTIAVDSPLSVSARQGVISSLQVFLDPLVGGDDGEGWAFGDPLRPSALLGIVQTSIGAAGSVLGVSVRIDSADATPQPCKDVTIQPYELVTLMHVDLVMQKRSPQSGGLR